MFLHQRAHGEAVQGKEEDLQEAPTLADYGPAAFLAPSTAYRSWQSRSGSAHSSRHAGLNCGSWPLVAAARVPETGDWPLLSSAL